MSDEIGPVIGRVVWPSSRAGEAIHAYAPVWGPAVIRWVRSGLFGQVDMGKGEGGAALAPMTGRWEPRREGRQIVALIWHPDKRDVRVCVRPCWWCRPRRMARRRELACVVCGRVIYDCETCGKVTHWCPPRDPSRPLLIEIARVARVVERQMEIA